MIGRRGAQGHSILSFGLFCIVGLIACVSALGQDAGPSARLREHAKLYHYHTNKNLPELTKTGIGDVIVEAFTISGPSGLSGYTGPHSYPHSFLVDSSLRADAIVVGVMKDSASALTQDEDFIFTDWTMNVEEVIKDNLLAPIRINSEIMLTRPGGALVLNGRNVRAIDTYFRPFHAAGRYVLFLSYIPITGAYRCFQDESFELLEKGVRKMNLRASGINVKDKQDPNAFLSEVRAAASVH